MTVVVDASAVVAALVATDDSGPAAAALLRDTTLVAPALLPFEVDNGLRRLQLSRRLSRELAELAHRDLLDLVIELWPYAAMADAAWRIRASLTAYDAAYVALAAELDVPFVTLDRRLQKAAKKHCEVIVPTAP